MGLKSIWEIIKLRGACEGPQGGPQNQLEGPQRRVEGVQRHMNSPGLHPNFLHCIRKCKTVTKALHDLLFSYVVSGRWPHWGQ